MWIKKIGVILLIIGVLAIAASTTYHTRQGTIVGFENEYMIVEDFCGRYWYVAEGVGTVGDPVTLIIHSQKVVAIN